MLLHLPAIVAALALAHALQTREPAAALDAGGQAHRDQVSRVSPTNLAVEARWAAAWDSAD